MRIPVVSLGIVAVLAASGICPGQSNGQTFELTAKASGARFTIEVVVPSGAPASGSKYPVV